jgi:hypothetical protein
VIPGQAALVTFIADRELDVYEVDDRAGRDGAKIHAAMSDARRNPHQSVVAITQNDPQHLAFRR